MHAGLNNCFLQHVINIDVPKEAGLTFVSVLIIIIIYFTQHLLHLRVEMFRSSKKVSKLEQMPGFTSSHQ
jgi:hypothetical protein